MRIIIDTDLKKTIVPKAFFDNIRQINDMVSITGRTEDLEWKEYLQTIIKDCTKDIINESDVPKKTRAKWNAKNISINAKHISVNKDRRISNNEIED